MGFHLAGEDHRDHLEARQKAVHPVKEEDHLEASGEVSPFSASDDPFCAPLP
jgi:hypothetical protein